MPSLRDLTRLDAAVLDLDGTLVDSVYAHVVAWRRAFLEVGVDVPAWQVHGAIGLGGDRLVAHVAGEATEEAVGDAVRTLHERHFEDLLPQVTPLPGASQLLDVLRRLGMQVAVASSGGEQLTDRQLDLIDARDLLHGWVAGTHVEETKPAPDLLDAALARLGADRALVVGDTVWDIATATARNCPGIGLLTGGIDAERLLQAGAVTVHDTPAELAAALEEVADPA